VFSVAIYHVDKLYGGPEEGGWWYEAGYPITDLNDVAQLPGDFKLPQYFLDEESAIVHQNNVQKMLNERVNRYRPSIGSVSSRGIYYARVEEGHPRPFPQERPHYE
jgi:hypothetical protein